MKLISAYLLLMLIGLVAILFVLLQASAGISDGIRLFLLCAVSGGFGGGLYCLRAVYLHHSAQKNWDKAWEPWYFLRPFASIICGAVSFLFLKAGLIILEAHQVESPSNLAFYAFAFAAGLNVDKFVEKIEDIAQVTWGIKKSRTAQKEGMTD